MMKVASVKSDHHTYVRDNVWLRKLWKIGQLSDVFYSLTQYIEDEVKGLMYGLCSV